MGKADKNSDKRKDVNKKADRENKQQTNSGSSNLESVSSSYNNLSENAQSKVNKKADRDVETSLGSDDHANNRVSVGNRKKIVTKFQTKEVGTSRGGGSLADESSEEDPEEDPEEEIEEDPEEEPEEDPEEDPQEENHADDSDDSDVVEQDVKVCDICGDAGREDNLCICSRCPDGAEHIYCSKVTLDKVPEGDWLCEECLDEENKNRNRRKYSTETGAEKDQSAEKDLPVVKVSGKRRAEESDSSSSGKQQAREKIIGSTKDVDRGKAKPSHQFASDSRFGNELLEGARSPPTRPRSESLRGNFVKSNSFNFPNGRSKTKLVDDLVLQRQKSTKERTSHEAREMGKSSSFRSNTLGFRSNNLGRFGESGSKVKMLSPNSSHVQDLGSLKNKKERNFERSNSVKTPSTSNLGTPSSTALTPRGDKLTVSSASNAEAKSLKGEGRMLSGTKSNSRSTNIGTEVPVSADPVIKQLSSSPTRAGIASSSGNNKSGEQRSLASKEDSLSRLATYKESTNPPTDVIKETTTTSQIGPGHSAQVQPTDKPGSVGSTASGLKSLQEINNGDNKLKDAIKEALRKKPGIYRKNKVFDQPDEVSVVPTKNNEVIPHSRNAVNLTSAEVSKDLQRQFSQSTTIDHSKQSNGNSSKPPMIFLAEGKHLTAGSSTYDDMALSSLPKISAIPDHECIWQGGFEINRSGKAAEFWDGLQAHLSTCASPRVLDSVNKLPHKIQLNGVSRISAWPTQFESSGVKETNIALYFFAKDLESYERSYQVLLDEMIRSDLALIGSFNGIELLIFPSNQLPERSNRWNMLFFLWGVFRGKKKNSLRQVPDCSEKNGIPKGVSFMPTDKTSSAEDACLGGPTDKDKRVPFEPKGILKLPQNSKLEKAIEKLANPLDSVNVAPVANKEIISSVPITDGNTSDPNKSDSQDVIKQSSFVKQVPVEELNRMQSGPKKRHFIDLSEDDDITTTDQINVWRDASSRIVEEGSMNKIQKSDFQEQKSHSVKTGAGDSNGKRYIFPLDLNEDIPLAGETDDIIMKEKGEDDGTASLSLSLAHSPAKIEEDGRMKGNHHSTPFNAYL